MLQDVRTEAWKKLLFLLVVIVATPLVVHRIDKTFFNRALTKQIWRFYDDPRVYVGLYRKSHLVFFDKQAEAAVSILPIYIEASDFDFEGNLYGFSGTEYGRGRLYKIGRHGDISVLSDTPPPPRNARICFIDSRGRLFLGSLDGKIYRSTDNGESFSMVLDPSNRGFYDEMWRMREGPDGTLYVAAHINPPEVWMSPNGGESWSVIGDETDFGTIESRGGNDINGFDVDDRGWIYAVPDTGKHAGLYRSKDQGETWVRITGDFLYRLEVLALNPLVFITSESSERNKIGLIIDHGEDKLHGIETLYTSVNKARNFMWGRSIPRKHGGRLLIFGSGSTGGLVNRSNSEIVISWDNGATWEKLLEDTNSLPRRSFYTSTAHPERSNCIYTPLGKQTLRLNHTALVATTPSS